MSNADALEFFESRAAQPFTIEHVHDEFTSLCPKTGHPDMGTITVRYEPTTLCVELKSLKIYFQSYRNEGIFYEALTNQMCRDLAQRMKPAWLQVISQWRGRGGIHSRILVNHGPVPAQWLRG